MEKVKNQKRDVNASYSARNANPDGRYPKMKEIWFQGFLMLGGNSKWNGERGGGASFSFILTLLSFEVSAASGSLIS